MASQVEQPEQLQLELNVLPTISEIIGESQKNLTYYRILRSRSVKQLKAYIRKLRNDEHDQVLSAWLWNISKGYSRWDKMEMVRTVMWMEWQIADYARTGKVVLR